MEIKYSKLHTEGKEPFRANESDAGYDLFSTEYVTLEPFQRNRMEIKPGDRIAQLIIEKCHTVEWKSMKTLEESQRGEQGFGSSGQ